MRSKMIGISTRIGAGVCPVCAHHAFTAEFDGNKPVKLRGTVTKMEWINPHAWIHIDVKDADGKVTNWMVECGSPNTLLRRGVTKASVTAGMEVLVDGYQSKDGSNKANGRDVTFAGRQEAVPGFVEHRRARRHAREIGEAHAHENPVADRRRRPRGRSVPRRCGARRPSSAALTGLVSSTEEGPMEGVMVSAKKNGGTITITVASDQNGRYSFPRNRLEAGQYSLRIRAVGYELDDPGRGRSVAGHRRGASISSCIRRRIWPRRSPMRSGCRASPRPTSRRFSC